MRVFRAEKLNVINFIRTNNSTHGRNNIFHKITHSHNKSFIISKGCDFNHKQKENVQ